jgi:hypothetical protein
MTTNVYDALSDQDLDGMLDRAYREAARCWQEHRRALAERPGMALHVRLTRDSAQEADAFFNALNAERRRRGR